MPNTMTEPFDMIVIGAGQAGPFLAAKLAEQGQRVALVEARDLGGTCINRGCTPTKTLRKSARVAHMARRAAEFGVLVGSVEVDFAAAMARMQLRVDASREGLERWLGGLPNLHIVRARAEITGRDGEQFIVSAGTRQLAAPRLVLNTGTRPFVPPIPGLTDVPYLDNESLLALRTRPAHLIVVGGSYIGLEMGQIFKRLGSQVSVVEPGPRLTAREDEDISAALTALLQAEGLAIHTGAAIERIARTEGSDSGVALHLAGGRTVSGSHVLMATGRVPNTDGLGLASIGLQTGPRGYIPTNERLETAVPGVWALGDINQRGAFTHTSYHDHEIVAANLADPANSAGGQRSADARIPTYAMFTDPPLGHVGIYEADARRLVAEQGRRISQAVFKMQDVSRAKEEGETDGLIKLLVDEDSGHFLGATMLGLNADEIIQIIGQVMAAGGTWRSVREALPVHPTVAEFLPTILDRRQAITS
jgi:pyruvate/2-oxoglutarate dehydrogenase complex dihydrolipoamide dehydrogenase (E3) component